MLEIAAKNVRKFALKSCAMAKIKFEHRSQKFFLGAV